MSEHVTVNWLVYSVVEHISVVTELSAVQERSSLKDLNRIS